jgi:hypothetical protein
MEFGLFVVSVAMAMTPGNPARLKTGLPAGKMPRTLVSFNFFCIFGSFVSIRALSGLLWQY